MKKLVGILTVIILILGVIFGYKIVYKASPRDFITKDTRIIYSNENINKKDFTPILALLDDEKSKEKFNSNLKDLKYISKFYIFSDKEFYELSDKSFTGVIDTGYWYFLLLKDIEKYFEQGNDNIYVMKKEAREKYLPELKSDIFMKNYRGLFIISLGEKNLKDFIEKDGKYLYNKEIEESLDSKKDELFGTLIYNNSGTDFYGITTITNSATIKDNKIISNGEIYIDENENDTFKSTKEKRELVKYINKNDIYVSIDDFSKLDKYIFNSFFLGANIDSKAIFAVWKNFLGIDAEEILKEIDGELILKVGNPSFMVKIKEDSHEIKRILTLLKDPDSVFYTDDDIREENGILTIGNFELKENANPYTINDGVFIFGKLNSKDIMGFEGMETSIEGRDQKIVIESEITIDLFKELMREY